MNKQELPIEKEKLAMYLYNLFDYYLVNEITTGYKTTTQAINDALKYIGCDKKDKPIVKKIFKGDF